MELENRITSYTIDHKGFVYQVLMAGCPAEVKTKDGGTLQLRNPDKDAVEYALEVLNYYYELDAKNYMDVSIDGLFPEESPALKIEHVIEDIDTGDHKADLTYRFTIVRL